MFESESELGNDPIVRASTKRERSGRVLMRVATGVGWARITRARMAIAGRCEELLQQYHQGSD